jgi:hypothetical protein
MENPVQLTPRFTEAVDYARQVHVGPRKGTQVPYMAHLLGVVSLVLGETGHVPFPKMICPNCGSEKHDFLLITQRYEPRKARPNAFAMSADRKRDTLTPIASRG